MPTVADNIVATLKASGVRRIYGLPGDSLNGFTDALRRSGDIAWEHVRHEEAAAFAAAAEAAITGDLAVVAASCGPGNLHLINGLFDANRSRVPVLAVAAHIPRQEIGSGYFQETHPQIQLGVALALVLMYAVAFGLEEVDVYLHRHFWNWEAPPAGMYPAGTYVRVLTFVGWRRAWRTRSRSAAGGRYRPVVAMSARPPFAKTPLTVSSNSPFLRLPATPTRTPLGPESVHLAGGSSSCREAEGQACRSWRWSALRSRCRIDGCDPA